MTNKSQVLCGKTELCPTELAFELQSTFMIQTGLSVYILKAYNPLLLLQGSAGRQHGLAPVPMDFNYRLEQKMTTLTLPRPPCTVTNTQKVLDWPNGDRCVL